MNNMQAQKPFEIPYEGNEFTRAARHKIDHEIGELERRMKHLRTKRNELSPIYVLPPEVLSAIFVLVRDLSGKLDDETHIYNHHAPWIRIGHVCHYWQEVTLDCPSLWSIPVFTRPNLAREMIRRSKTAPLIIELSLTGSIWNERKLEQVGNALTQIQRIQSIKLRLPGYIEELGAISSLLSTPRAPLLQNLSVRLGIDSGDFSFPLDALSDAPCLQSIDLSLFKFSWNSAIFRHGNLTNLQLRNNLLDGTSTIGQMMDVLHHSPKLRILELIDAIPSHATRNGNEKVVELKFLEQLVLDAKAPDCIFLLRHMQYPSHTAVRLQSSKPTSIEDSRTIISFLGQNLCRTHSPETGVPHCPVVIRSAQLTLVDLVVCGITFFNTKVDDVENDETPRILSGQPDPIIQIHLRSNFAFSFGHVHFLTDIYNSFNLSSLEYLVLDCTFTDNHTRAIQDTLGKLPKLKTIYVLNSHSIIYSALQNSNCEGAELRSSSPVACFPALKTLIVEDVDFEEYTILRHLVLALKFRTLPEINMPLDRLVFRDCTGVLTEDGERLRGWARELIRAFVRLVAYLAVNGRRFRVAERLRSNDRSDRGDSGDGGEGEGVEEEHHSHEDEDQGRSSDKDEGEEKE